jgi:hypothetical protein
MAVSMNEIILHQHLEEARSSQTSNNSIQRMSILLKVGYWNSFNKSLNQNSVTGQFFEGLREVDKFIVIEVLIEDFEVVFFNVEVYLIY